MTAKASKKVNILEEQSTMLLATYDDFEIEVFPLPEGNLTDVRGWGYRIIDTYGGHDEVAKNEDSLFNSARISLIVALSDLIRYDYGTK